ncbi:MAG: hypothetical protein M3422_06795 [Actinomycetota bacterium]|nr:hypothetical protein [Actinomycetota bacterium]
MHRIAVAVAVLVTAVACTEQSDTGGDGARFEPPGWGRPEAASIPADVTSLSQNAADWDGGVLLSGNELAPKLITSKDLVTWRHTLPDDLVEYTYHPIAGHGPAAYVLGSNAEGTFVWRTENGDTWERVPLPGAYRAPYLSIAAGPKGVVVAGYDEATATYASTGAVYTGYRIWFSADGREFEQAAEVPAATVYESDGVEVTATGEGFLLTSDARGGGVHESTDGRQWTLATGLPDTLFDAVGMAGGTTVALTTWLEDDSEEEPGLSAYFHRAGAEQWSEGTIDLGTLPDVGVEPRAAQYVWGVTEWGGGFIAYGGTNGGAGVGAVWTSPDGATWTRMSIRDSGFDRTRLLFAAVQAGDGTALLGMDTSINGPALTVWRTAAD